MFLLILEYTYLGNKTLLSVEFDVYYVRVFCGGKLL